mgnify:CR=1 FL=1|tara:strand:+ start:156 stop:506 length:351 start_codon:yes stop_codon:yes gene_type:complete
MKKYVNCINFNRKFYVRKVEFKEYLSSYYKREKSNKPLTLKAIFDVCSRCQRVERSLKVDLDNVLNGTDQSYKKVFNLIISSLDKFGWEVKTHSTFGPINHAIKRYNEFLMFEEQE